tara:strand:- start:742 stop:1230 length:489 start_codon:yes stop_codon:yes gene_type:complete
MNIPKTYIKVNKVDNLSSKWYNSKKLLVTRISGTVTLSDVIMWEDSLYKALQEIQDNDVFKIYVNLFGFKAQDVETHKKFRNIIPVTLSKYGWRVGYLDLFEEANDLKLSCTRGIRCLGAAHVHQDKSKINKYQFFFGIDNEAYFHNPSQASKWINELSLKL